MTRTRVAILGLVSALCVTVAIAYVAYARSAPPAGTAAAPAVTADLAGLLGRPHIVVRNAVLGSDYGRVAVVALDDPGGPRALGPVSCERVYAVRDRGVCVSAKRGIVPSYALTMLGAGLQPVSRTDLVGLPSRARMSADGSLVGTTTFVSGHSYAQARFSTATVPRRHGTSLGNLETWRTTLPNGQRLTAADRNFWGITFAADNETFYATAASGKTTWLVRGSLGRTTMTALRTDAECPSLSPDGTRVAYKKRLGSAKPGDWRLAVLDLRTGEERLLGESRAVDDQVEWLDSGRVLYALSRPGTEATTSDIWVVPVDGSEPPRVLIERASSPAVVRG